LGGAYQFLITPIIISEDTRPLIAVSLGVVAVNVTANALLVPGHGAHGAAVATTASYAALCIGAVVVAGPRSARWTLRRAHLAVLAASVAVVLACAALAPATGNARHNGGIVRTAGPTGSMLDKGSQ